MIWIPIVVWAGAVVIALVVLGFCSYELVWKSKRLQADMNRLRQAAGELDAVRSALAGATQAAQSIAGRTDAGST